MKRLVALFVFVILIAACCGTTACTGEKSPVSGIDITDDLPSEDEGGQEEPLQYSEEAIAYADSVLGTLVLGIVNEISGEAVAEEDRAAISAFIEKYFARSFVDRQISEQSFVSTVGSAENSSEKIIRLVSQVYSGAALKSWYPSFKSVFSDITKDVGADTACRLLYDFTILVLRYAGEIKEREDLITVAETIEKQVTETGFCESLRILYACGDVVIRTPDGGNAFEGYSSQDVVLLFKELSYRLSRVGRTVKEEGWIFILDYVAGGIAQNEQGFLSDVAGTFISSGDVKTAASYCGMMLLAVSYACEKIGLMQANALIKGNYSTFAGLMISAVRQSDVSAIDSLTGLVFKDEAYVETLGKYGLEQQYEEYVAGAGYAVISDLYSSKNEAEADKNLRGWLNLRSPFLGFLIYGYDDRS